MMADPAMFRFRLDLEYDGTPYCGWQSQRDGKGVQDALERAILRLQPQLARLHCAGRTDAGVHALGQVAHLDLARDWEGGILRDALNAHLRLAGEAIAVLSAGRVDPCFDARLDARARIYRYRILNRRAPSALDSRFVWHIARPLDAAAMHRAAQTILGRHDFTTFRAASCQAKSPIRTLDRLDVAALGEEIHVAAVARSFLHHQVRSFVGSLERIGEGAWPEVALIEALEARDRARCGPVAPAQGLCLMRVDYTAHEGGTADGGAPQTPVEPNPPAPREVSGR